MLHLACLSYKHTFSFSSGFSFSHSLNKNKSIYLYHTYRIDITTVPSAIVGYYVTYRALFVGSWRTSAITCTAIFIFIFTFTFTFTFTSTFKFLTLISILLCPLTSTSTPTCPSIRNLALIHTCPQPSTSSLDVYVYHVYNVYTLSLTSHMSILDSGICRLAIHITATPSLQPHQPANLARHPAKPGPVGRFLKLDEQGVIVGRVRGWMERCGGEGKLFRPMTHRLAWVADPERDGDIPWTLHK